MLPFLTTAELQKTGGSPVAGVDAVPVSIWALSSARPTSRGEVYDWEGEAAIAFAEELAKPDRQLQVDGERYVIVSAVAHRLGIPHVALRLVRAGRRGGL